MSEMSPLLITVLTGLRQAIDRLDGKVEKVDGKVERIADKLTESLSKEGERIDTLASRVDKLYTIGSMAIFILPFAWSVVVDYVKSFFGGKT